MTIKKNERLGLRRAKSHKYHILAALHKSTTFDNIEVNIWSFNGIAYHWSAKTRHFATSQSQSKNPK
jgi:hypothetical protein